MHRTDAGGKLCSLFPSAGQAREVMGDNQPRGELQAYDMCVVARRWGSRKGTDSAEEAQPLALWESERQTFRVVCRYRRQTQIYRDRTLFSYSFSFLLLLIFSSTRGLQGERER